MPPANAAAIFHILTHIDAHPSSLLTRASQTAFLKDLTRTYKFSYHSSTYGHTTHDEKSLRKVLGNTMRNHPNPEFGVASGNAAVDMLFEIGSEMLDRGYVEEVRRAGEGVVVERRGREGSDEEESDEETGVDDEDDEDFVVSGRKLRATKAVVSGKRRLSAGLGRMSIKRRRCVGHSSTVLQGRQCAQRRASVEILPSNTDIPDPKLREAVERLNRRVHTAIVQLWDEIGSPS